MLTVAYLANVFPSAVEPYVVHEIEELRRRGVRVVPGSVRRTRGAVGSPPDQCAAVVVLQPLPLICALRALWLCAQRWRQVVFLLRKILFGASEGVLQRFKALAHTFLGACYAVMLTGRGIDHIHVHHGYFGSWIAMTAARMLGVEFSITLHGSDLLLHGTYLDVKLSECAFCLTVSEYNRQYVLQHYISVEPAKVLVGRMGVDVGASVELSTSAVQASGETLTLLASWTIARREGSCLSGAGVRGASRSRREFQMPNCRRRAGTSPTGGTDPEMRSRGQNYAAWARLPRADGIFV